MLDNQLVKCKELVGFASLRSARPTSLHEKQKAPAAAEAFFDARGLMKASFQGNVDKNGW